MVAERLRGEHLLYLTKRRLSSTTSDKLADTWTEGQPFRFPSIKGLGPLFSAPEWGI